jgi:hypothetical protein
MRAGRTRVAATAMLSAVCVLHAASAAAASSAVAAPDLKVGDRWVYHAVDGYRTKMVWDETHEVTAIGPDGITVTVTTKGLARDTTRTEIWSAPGVVRSGAIYESETDRFDPPLIRYQYPMSVGTSWSQRVRNLDKPPDPYGPISYRATVRGQEKVTTPAGTFDALRISYVIQLDDESLAQYPTQCEYTFWYAASVGAAVREQRRSYSTQKGGGTSPRVPGQNAQFTLTSFTRGR